MFDVSNMASLPLNLRNAIFSHVMSPTLAIRCGQTLKTSAKVGSHVGMRPGLARHVASR